MARAIAYQPENTYHDGVVPDAAARAMALDMGRSILVRAPAGSGKTSLLVKRIIRALALVDRPESVLAFTFTNKAAAEMRSRVIEELSHNSADPDVQKVLDNSERYEWHLLEQPQRLRIQTIDAFCGAITQQLPLTSGIGAAGSPTDDALPLYREAILRVIAAMDDPEEDSTLQAALTTLMRASDNRVDKLVEPLTALLQSRERWMDSVMRRTYDETHGGGEDVLMGWLEQAALELAQALPETLRSALMDLWQARDAAELVDGLDEDFLNTVRSGVAPPVDGPSLAFWAQALSVVTAQKGTFYAAGGMRAPLWPASAKPIKTAWLAALDTLSEEQKAATESALPLLRMVPSARLPDELHDYNRALDTVLVRLLAELHLVFAETGQMDFTEVSLRALAALRNLEGKDRSIMEALDLSLQHILVDEMQDTSHNQMNLLRTLTSGWEPDDGRTLFLVGDPQQSIYAFRDADVGLFIRLWVNAALDRPEADYDLPLDTVTLEANFRSLPEIVDFNNAVFGTVFPQSPDPLRGAIQKSLASAWMRPVVDIAAAHPDLGDLPAVAGAHWHRHSQADGPNAEAIAVVDAVQAGLGDNTQRTFGIIGRSRKALRPVIAELMARGIGYVAEDIDELGARPEVRPVVALARALWHRGDSVAWATFLRSPLVGLSWAELHAIKQAAQHTGRDYDWVAVLEHAARQAHTLDRDTTRRVQAVLDAYKAATHAAGYRGHFPRQVERMWVRLNGPATLQAPHEVENVRTTLALLTQENDKGGPQMMENFVRRLGARYSRAPATNARVSVMTIHKAKGLEFDEVHIVGAGARPRPDRAPLLMVFAESDDVLTVPEPPQGRETSDEWTRLRAFCAYILKLRAQSEDHRVGYVAGTRAGTALHWHEVKAVGDDGNLQDAPAGSLAQRLDADRLPAIAGVATTRAAPAPVAAPVTVCRDPLDAIPMSWRLPANYTVPASCVDSVQIRAKHTERPSDAALSVKERSANEHDEEDLTQTTTAILARRVRGDMAHALLQRIGERGLDAYWKDDQVVAGEMNAMLPSLCAGLRRYGYPGESVTEAAQDIQRLVAGMLQTEQGRWVLQSRANAQCEYPLSGYLNGAWFSAVIDRMFEDDGVLWLIDYKSGERTTDAIAHYSHQMERYKAIMAQFRPGVPIKVGLYWLAERVFDPLAV